MAVRYLHRRRASFLATLRATPAPAARRQRPERPDQRCETAMLRLFTLLCLCLLAAACADAKGGSPGFHELHPPQWKSFRSHRRHRSAFVEAIACTRPSGLGGAGPSPLALQPPCVAPSARPLQPSRDSRPPWFYGLGERRTCTVVGQPRSQAVSCSKRLSDALQRKKTNGLVSAHSETLVSFDQSDGF
jgi:hypothetical protein